MFVRALSTLWERLAQVPADPGGALTEAHAQFRLGLDQHLDSPHRAFRAYELARLAYADRGATALSRLAGVGAASVSSTLIDDGDRSQVDERLALAGDQTLTEAFEAYAAVLCWLAGTGEMPAVEGAEGARLLRQAALRFSGEDATVALKVARFADGIAPEVEALDALARRFVGDSRWDAAIEALEELQAADAVNPVWAVRLAGAYAEADRWPEARALLLRFPGSPEALRALIVLGVGRNDPEVDAWREQLQALDPASDPLSGMPEEPASRRNTAPQRLAASFADGALSVSDDFFALPVDERAAHSMAAILAGSPDGREQFERLLVDDPPLAERVARLLGIRIRSAAQLQAEERFRAGEEHFGARRYAEAEREYAAALALDSEHVLAATYLGDTHYQRAQFHLAQAFFEEALAIEPTPIAHRFRGDALLKGGHGARRARAAYEAALALDPNYRGAREALATPPPSGPAWPPLDRCLAGGDAALAGGRLDEALGLYQHALYLAEDEHPRVLSTALDAVGRGYRAAGAPRAALGYFERSGSA